MNAHPTAPLRVLLCAALILLESGLGILPALLQQDPSVANAQRRRRPRYGYIEISSAVADAEIFINGELVGLTPMDKPIKVEAGQHTIKIVRPGYTPFLETVEVPPGRRPFLVEALMLPISGIFTIRTAPQGARISVDGRFIGQSPFNGEIDEGQRVLEIAAPGYKVHSVTMPVVGGESYELDVTLELQPEVEPFYTTWWFWTGVGVVALGTIVTVVVLSAEDEPAQNTGPPRIVLPLWEF